MNPIAPSRTLPRLPAKEFETEEPKRKLPAAQKPMKSPRILFCAMLFGLLSAAQTQDLDTSRGPVYLKFDLLPGKTYVQTMATTQTTLMEVQGQKVNQKVDTTMVLSMAVEKAPQGKTVTVTYDRISMKQDMGGMSFSFDSADPRADPGPFAFMGSMVGKPIQVILSNEGKILSVKGVENLLPFADGSNPAAGEMTKHFLGEEQLAQMMNVSMSSMIPPQPVAPGDTWPIDISLSVGPLGDITYRGSGELLGYQNLDGEDVAVIKIDARTGINISAQPSGEGGAAAPLAAINMKLEEGASVTRLYWDNRIGFLRASEMTQKMKMSMTNPADGSALIVPFEQTVKTSVEIK